MRHTRRLPLSACFALASLLALADEALPQNVVDTQERIDIVLASRAACGSVDDNHLKLIINASSSVDCDTTGEPDSGSWVTAACICDSGTLRAATVVEIEEVPAATTSVAGIVELATAGENAANVVVQGNDARVNATRKVRVMAGATDVAGVIYDTIADAITYVTAQTRTASARWVIAVEGGGAFEEAAFSLPTYTELTCASGAELQSGFFQGSTIIQNSALASGNFISLADGSGIRGCHVLVAGTPTATRSAVSCEGAGAGGGVYPCYLIDSSIEVRTGGAEVDVAYDATATPTTHSYLRHVWIGFSGSNSNQIGVRIGTNDYAFIFDSFIEPSSGGSSKGLQFLANSPAYVEVFRTQINGRASNSTNWSTPISAEGTGVVITHQSNFQSWSGTVHALNWPVSHASKLGILAAPPFTCDAAAEGWSYADDEAGMECYCNGTNWVQKDDYSTTTGCAGT